MGNELEVQNIIALDTPPLMRCWPELQKRLAALRGRVTRHGATSIRQCLTTAMLIVSPTKASPHIYLHY